MKITNNGQVTEIKSDIPKERYEIVRSFGNGYTNAFFVLTSEGHIPQRTLFEMLEHTLSDGEHGVCLVEGHKCLHGGFIQWIVLDRNSFIVDAPVDEEGGVVRIYQKSKNWSWILNNLCKVVASNEEANESNEEVNDHSMVA